MRLMSIAGTCAVLAAAAVLGWGVLLPQAPAARAVAAAEAAAHPEQRGRSARKREVKNTVQGTLEEAIRALEAYDCETVAVEFLNPIRRAAIPDLQAHREASRCSPEDPRNVEEFLLVLRLARGGVPEYRGITATISLEGVGLRIQQVTLMKYLDGKWYFNQL